MSTTNVTRLSDSNQITSRKICTTTKEKYQIDLSDAIADITANIIHNSEHFQLPSEIFEKAVIRAINDLVDDFAINPNKYLKRKHLKQINEIAHHYLNS